MPSAHTGASASSHERTVCKLLRGLSHSVPAPKHPGKHTKFPQNWTWPGSGMVLPANDLSECPLKFSGPKMPASCFYWQISHSVSTCFQDPCSLSEKTLKRSSSHIFSSEHCLCCVVVIVLSGYLMENKYDKNNECYKI